MAGRPSAVRRPSIARISSARSGRPARSSRRPAQRASSTCPKRGSGGEVVAVRVDVLAEQRDLAIAGRGERARLVDDVVERPAPLRPAAERHDAVGAGLVAAVDDRQPGGDRGAARDGPLPDRQGARAGQMVGRPDHGPADGRRRRPTDRSPRSAPAPRRAPAGRRARAPRPAAGTGPPPGSGGADRPGRARGPSSRSARPACAGLAALSFASWPCRPMTFCSAPSRIAHVLMTTRSAASRLGASSQPAASRLPGHLLRIAPVHLAAERPDVEARQGPRLGQVLHEPLVVGRGRGARARPRRRARARASAGRGSGSIDRSWLCRRAYDAARRGCQPATSGGTHRPACASAYVLVSPW